MTRSFRKPVVRYGALLLLALAVTGLAGCVSRSTAQIRARRAYLAGQQAAAAQTQPPAQPNVPTISIVGPVQNNLLLWSEGLTLAQAIVQAGYESQSDPVSIIIHRNGQEIPFSPRRLLNGEDFPLEPQDIVHLQP
jgi:hypothetical protein